MATVTGIVETKSSAAEIRDIICMIGVCTVLTQSVEIVLTIWEPGSISLHKQANYPHGDHDVVTLWFLREHIVKVDRTLFYFTKI